MVHLKKAENRVMDELYFPLHTSTEKEWYCAAQSHNTPRLNGATRRR